MRLESELQTQAVGVVKLKVPTGHLGLAWRAGPELPIVSSHRHAELEMNLVLRGAATYLFAGRRDLYTAAVCRNAMQVGCIGCWEQ